MNPITRRYVVVSIEIVGPTVALVTADAEGHQQHSASYPQRLSFKALYDETPRVGDTLQVAISRWVADEDAR